MIYISIIFLLIVIIINIRIGELKSPLFIFSILWFLVLFFYQLHLYGLYSISQNTEFIIFCGISSYIIGYLIGYIVCKHLPVKNNNNKIINKKKLYILIISVIICSIPFYSEQLFLLIKNGFDVHVNKIALVLGESNRGGIIMQFFIRPFEFIIVGISSYYIFDKKSSFILRYSGIIVSLLKYLATGSRTILFYMMICTILSYIFLYAKNNRKRWKKIILLLTVFIMIMVFTMDNLLKQLYFYLCGCISLFDQVINTTFYYDGTQTLGMLSFNGIIRFFLNILSLFGININPPLFSDAEGILRKFEYTKYVAPNYPYNAFTTYMSNFYIDFGLLGVILGSLLFGFISAYIFYNFKKNKNLENYLLFVLMIYFIVFSVVRFQLSNTILACSLIYTIIFFIFARKIRIRLK